MFDDDLDPEDQSPTPEAFLKLVAALESFLALTGPNTPPGYEDSTPFSGWARFRWKRTVEAVAELQRTGCPRDRVILPGKIDRALIEADPIQAWPDEVCEALARLREELTWLFGNSGWGIILADRRLDELPTHWREAKWLDRAMFPGRAEIPEPEPGSIFMPFPLLVEPKRHRNLRWVASVLTKHAQIDDDDGENLTGNAARDRFFWRERRKNRPWKAIRREANETEGWTKVNDDSNARMYANRHARPRGLPLLTGKGTTGGDHDDIKRPDD